MGVLLCIVCLGDDHGLESRYLQSLGRQPSARRTSGLAWLHAFGPSLEEQAAKMLSKESQELLCITACMLNYSGGTDMLTDLLGDEYGHFCQLCKQAEQLRTQQMQGRQQAQRLQAH